MRNFASVLAVSAMLAGCGSNESQVNDFQWAAGDTWHVAASYRVGAVKTEERATPLENADPSFNNPWSDEVVWQYQVVESGLVPSEGDALYPYAQRRGQVESLAVVRAYIDTSITSLDKEMVAADPVVYFVFHEDRDRLAAVVQFTNVDGERQEQAWSSNELDASWSKLSQSMLTAAPSYLAPVGVKNTTETRTLENGTSMDLISVDETHVDVVFDDSMGSGLVVARYEDGAPWPTSVEAENLSSRVVTEDEVRARRAARGEDGSNEPPEDYDFRAALSGAVNLDAAFILDESTIVDGWTSGAPDGFEPWNGWWWPQSGGAMVFGYKENGSKRPTYSDELRPNIDPLKKELDGLSETLRDLDEESDEYATTVETYRTKQSELIDQLVEFYTGMLSGLDGGQITVQNGQISHSVDGWSYDLDELSPMDKQALAMYFDGKTYPNPFYMQAWELLNHYSPEGGSWWGHCNGWAAAAILTHEPTESLDVSINGNTVAYTTADLKGLLTESHYSTYSRFYGARYYKDGDDINDLYPADFHKLITHYFRDVRVPVVFDTTASDQVWNFPAYSASVFMEETTPEGAASLVNVNTASAEELDALPGIGVALAGRIIDYRDWNGPFQAVDDLALVRGIGSTTVNKLRDQATVQDVKRTFDVIATVKFATDGVDAQHVDVDGPEAAGFTNIYSYTLETDQDGRLLPGGTWDDPNEHPDFAWVPYANPTGRTSGGSENPYMPYGDLTDTIGSFDRK